MATIRRLWELAAGGKRVPSHPPDDDYDNGRYGRTATNPKGKHRAQDHSAPVGTLLVAPEPHRITFKGWYGDAGLVIEIYLGHSKRYRRYFHCKSVTAAKVGSTGHTDRPLGRVGMTGNTRGPHVHVETGKYPLKKARDPRYNDHKIELEAWRAKRLSRRT